jgi:uncharacterized protein YbjT (DUF2867 family)
MAIINREECFVIVVTGATGNIGGELVRRLSSSGAAVRGLTRHASRARFPEGTQVAEGDLRDPGSLEPAFSQAEAVFLVAADEANMAAIVEQARRAGVTHVVLVSALAAQTHPELPFGQHSLRVEQAVREAGMSWTILRPGQLASNALWWAEPIRRQGTVRAPFAQVALPVIDPADVAAVAHRVLTTDGHQQRVYPLTGPQAVTPPQQVAAIGAALGRDLAFTEITAEQAVMHMTQHMPPEVAESILDLRGRATTAEDSRVLPTVEEVTGTPARTFRQWADDHADAFR